MTSQASDSATNSYVEDQWLPCYTADQLYLQMCENEVEDPQAGYDAKISKYYLEAAKYAGRISAGDFNGQNAKNKPIFTLYLQDFTTNLKANLAELYKESRDSVVKDAVFRIFKARHKMIFYEYIQNEHFKWRFH